MREFACTFFPAAKSKVVEQRSKNETEPREPLFVALVCFIGENVELANRVTTRAGLKVTPLRLVEIIGLIVHSPRLSSLAGCN